MPVSSFILLTKSIRYKNSKLLRACWKVEVGRLEWNEKDSHAVRTFFS